MPLPAEPRADAAEQQVDPVQRGGEGGHEGRHGMPVEHLPQPPPHARDRSTCRRRRHLLYARVRSTSHNSSASSADRRLPADRGIPQLWRLRRGPGLHRGPPLANARGLPVAPPPPMSVSAECAEQDPTDGASPLRRRLHARSASPADRRLPHLWRASRWHARSAPTSSAAPPRRELQADRAGGVHPLTGRFGGPPTQHGRCTPGTLEVGPRGLFAPMPPPSQAPWRISLQSSMSLPPIAPSSPHPLKMIDWQCRLRQASGACAVLAHELLRSLHQALRFQPVSLSYCSGVARNCILLLFMRKVEVF
ncbi:hypothetical protein PAHAL_9G390100 [Panicum hallii]|uniref:Uncharacterized protein n=1 Tax=Panicum hallii TaxID=206008 RepID=A0A2S3INT5_9POAL|nr:hypothetical protein PAHAL_9G390100 [Panicum hallii]